MTPTTCVPVPATPYKVNVAPPAGLVMVVGPPVSRGAPLAEVTAVDVPRYTSALAWVEDKITVVAGGTTQTRVGAVPPPLVGTVTWYRFTATVPSCHHGRMTEPEEISGEIVKAPPAADIRYEDDSRVTRVFVRVEWAGGKIREYQALEPQGFEMNEPESWQSHSFQPTGVSFSAGGLFVRQQAAVASLRLSFKANPRYNMHIRTEATAPEDFPGITYG